MTVQVGPEYAVIRIMSKGMRVARLIIQGFKEIVVYTTTLIYKLS